MPPKPPGREFKNEIQARTTRFITRHPALLALIRWLGWNNPGGGMNP